MKLRVLALVAGLHLLAAVLFLSRCGPGFPLDDAWGHLVYGRSLATLHGLSYNPGQPEAGVTSPLWTYLCAVPAGLVEWGLQRRPDFGMRLLGLLFGFFACLAGARLARRAGPWPETAVILLLTFDPLLLAGRFSGMELPLFALLSLLFVEAQLDDRPTRLGWICGLALLTRPEALLFIALALPRQLRTRGRATAFLLPLLLCALPFAAWNQWVAGHPWPNTWSNKADFVLQVRPLFDALGALARDTGLGWALLLLLVAGAFGLEGVTRGLARTLLFTAGALLLGVLLTRPMPVGFDGARVPFYFERYALLAWPLLLVVAAAGGASLVRTAWAGTRCKLAAGLALASPLLLTLALAHGAPAHAANVASRFAAECADVEALNVVAGSWIDAHLSLTALVATHDAGAVRYFGKRHVLDIFGNNDAHLADLQAAGERATAEGDEAAAARAHEALMTYLRSRDPDVLACFPLVDAVNHAPELQRLPPGLQQELLATRDDYAAALGLTKRVASFHVDQSATVGGVMQRDFAVYVRP
jgi:hypothetical protein